MTAGTNYADWRRENRRKAIWKPFSGKKDHETVFFVIKVNRLFPSRFNRFTYLRESLSSYSLDMMALYPVFEALHGPL